ncbi:unnamed protein product, partial [Owenia fusiformis]
QIQSQLGNLEDSYLSLQATAEQIKERLAEILERWEEYKATVQDCQVYMEGSWSTWASTIEPLVTNSLEHCEQLLTSANEMSIELDAYKQKLSSQQQRCASMGSIESLEQLDLSTTSELTTLAEHTNDQLSTSIDKVTEVVSKLKELLKQWQTVEKQKTQLHEWLNAREADLQEFESKPAKLHMDAAEHELQQLKDSQQDIKAKQPSIESLFEQHTQLTSHTAEIADADIEEIQNGHKSVLERIDKLISSRSDWLSEILDYHTQFKDLNANVEKLETDIERIHNDIDVTVADRAEEIKRVSFQLSGLEDQLGNTKARAESVQGSVSKHDDQLVQDQIRDLEQRFTELSKKTKDQLAECDTILVNYDTIIVDLDSYSVWMQDKQTKLEAGTLCSYKMEEAISRQQHIECLVEELETKEDEVDELVVRGEDLRGNLSRHERDIIDRQLQTLRLDHHKLLEKSRDECKLCSRAVEVRTELHALIEKISVWLEEREKVVSCLEPMKLRSSEIQEQINKNKAVLSEISAFEVNLVRLEKQTCELECSEESKPELLETAKDLSDRYSKLKTELQTWIDNAKTALPIRKKFETDIVAIETWQTEVNGQLNKEVSLEAPIDTLKDHARKLQDQEKKQSQMAALLQQLTLTSEQFENLSEAEQQSLQEQITMVTHTMTTISQSITTMHVTLTEATESRNKFNEEIKASAAVVSTVQEDLKRLTGPIGPRVEDAQTLIEQFVDIQDTLADLSPDLGQLEQSKEQLASQGQISVQQDQDLVQLTALYEQLTQQVSERLELLRQAESLREDFTEERSELEQQVKQTQDEMDSMAHMGVSVPVKLDRYQSLVSSLSLQQVPLEKLNDKAKQIASQTLPEDSHSVLSQANTLQSTLETMLKQCQRKAKECQEVLDERQTFSEDLEKALTFLKQKNDVTKQHSTLGLDSQSITKEYTTLEQVSKEVNDCIRSIRLKIEDQKMKFDESDEPMTLDLADNIDEFEELESTLKKNIKAMDQVLNEAKVAREEYDALYDEVASWVRSCEEQLKDPYSGIEYNLLEDQLTEHREYYADENQQHLVLDKLMDLSEAIIVTLDKNDEQTLTQSLTNLTNKVSSTIGKAAKKETKLQQHLDNWNEYQSLLSQAGKAIDDGEMAWSTID